MTRPHPFAQDNIRYLQQGLELLAALPDSLYVQVCAAAGGSNIGGHVRHILDHYQCFLDGLVTQRIDYDARRRDLRVESERTTAADALRATLRALDELHVEDGLRALEVRMDCGGSPEERHVWGGSSVARELQFLTSHTVHHYALIAAILRQAGHVPAPGFGVSPSTLRYEAQRRQKEAG